MWREMLSLNIKSNRSVLIKHGSVVVCIGKIRVAIIILNLLTIIIYRCGIIMM